MYKSYEITCIYDPIHHYVNEGEGLLIIPSAYIADYDEISSQITSAGAGIKTINVLSSIAESELVLYLSYNDMEIMVKKLKRLIRQCGLAQIQQLFIHSKRITRLKTEVLSLSILVFIM